MLCASATIDPPYGASCSQCIGKSVSSRTAPTSQYLLKPTQLAVGAIAGPNCLSLLLHFMIRHSTNAIGPAPQAVTKNSEVDKWTLSVLGGPFSLIAVVPHTCRCHHAWACISIPISVQGASEKLPRVFHAAQGSAQVEIL